MTRILAGLALALLGVAALGQGPLPSHPADVGGADVQDVVFLADGRPYLIRLHLYTHGRPFRLAWDEFVATVFAQLDRNKDGVIGPDEVGRLGAVQSALGLTRMPAPKGKSLSRADLADLLRRAGARPLQFHGGGGGMSVFADRLILDVGGGLPQSGGADAVTSALFRLLDTNRDGVLSPEEIAAAPGRLRKQDLDEDECVTVAEILGRGPRGLADGQLAFAFIDSVRTEDTGPLVPVEPGAADLSLGRRILAQYGKEGAQRIKRSEIGLDDNEFARLDADGDGELDAAELARFGRGPIDLELIVRVGPRAAGQPAVELVRKPGGPGLPPALDSLMTALGGTRLDWHVGSPPGGLNIVIESVGGSVDSLKQQYTEQFRAADRDKNGYLDAREAKQSPFFANLFEEMDADHDGKLYLKEVLAYAERTASLQSAAARARIALSVSDQGNGLFDLLDANHDGRLSERELRKAPEVLRSLAKGKGGMLRRSDVPRNYRVDVGPGSAGGTTFLAVANEVRVWADFGGAAPGAPQTGPLWFRKMDRNRDGDVSRKEFLGTDAQFREIDTDGDGLISLEEAECYDKRMRGKK